MCGAFPLHLCRAARLGTATIRLLLYALGKLFTYAFLGAVAGALGHWVVRSELFIVPQHLFSYAVGGMMLLVGLTMVGAFDSIRLPSAALPEWPGVQRIAGALLQSPGPGGSLLLGLTTGLLPCPITVALITVAAASHSVILGIVTMVGLGVGSAVPLVAIGLSGALVHTRLRHIGLRAAGVIAVLIGTIAILRPTHVLCHILPPPAIGAEAEQCESHE
jgi:sulfite exporter TauE/SafE